MQITNHRRWGETHQFGRWTILKKEEESIPLRRTRIQNNGPLDLLTTPSGIFGTSLVCYTGSKPRSGSTGVSKTQHPSMSQRLTVFPSPEKEAKIWGVDDGSSLHAERVKSLQLQRQEEMVSDFCSNEKRNKQEWKKIKQG